MASEKANVRGFDLAYEVTGSGPTMIWGHGLSQSRASESVVSLLDLDRVGCRMVRYDARGHGESEMTAQLSGYSWEEMARDQLALADHLGIDRYIVAGASMGGGAALHVAVLAPERVDRLVVVTPPVGWEARAERAALWEQSAQLLESEGVEAVIAARAELPPPDPVVGDEVRREQINDNTRAWDPKQLSHVMRGAATANLPDRARIAEIDVPTLVLAWTGDPVHPLSTATELHELIPGAVLHVASTRAELDGWTEVVDAFVRRDDG